jgi:formate hydrogenlyase subunit 4
MDALGFLKVLLGGFANVVAVLLLAPLFEGVLRKVTARIQSRQGPPLWQPYFDLLKLLGKEDIESGESPLMQRVAAYLSLGAVLSVAWLVPMGFGAPLNESGDVILLVYLLGLCAISTLLAGLAAGSTYSLMGISREMMSVITLEPLLVVTLIVGAVHTGSLRLDAVLDGSVYIARLAPVSGVLMLGVMLLAFQAFVQRVPFDTAEAETEIMEGPLMEYSGPKLALLKYAQMAKLVVYGALVVGMFVPWGADLPFLLRLPLFWGKVLVLVLAVTLVAATHARYRIDQVLRYYVILLGVAFVALLLAVKGY